MLRAMPSGAAPPLTLMLALSAVVHVVAGVAVHAVPLSVGDSPRPAPDVEVSIVSAPEPETRSVEPPESHPDVRRAPRAVHRPRVRPVEPEPQPDPVEQAEEPRVVLDPVVVSPGPAPVRVPAPSEAAAWALRSLGPPARSAPRASERGEAIGRGLGEELHRPPHESHRPPPTLVPRDDGGFSWNGHALRAIVRPNGEVVFADRAPIELDGVDPFDVEGNASRTAPGALFRFDINDALERAHGNDPYFAERRWFLESTESLRDGLARAHREKTETRGIRKLRVRLGRLLGDESRPLRARRRELFTMWDDCAEAGTGERARRVIERFIRDELPQGTEKAYGADELRRLNAGRVSREPFSPYGP